MGRILFPAAYCLAFAGPAVAGPGKPDPAAVEFFEAKVRPVLVEHCVRCHGPKKQEAGLRLDTAAGLAKGTDAGPVVVAGDPGKSLLVKAVRRDSDTPMPPDKPLPADAVAVLTEWVKGGAVFPDAATERVSRTDPKAHWAFRPVADPPVPAAKSLPASAGPIDHFVAAKLEGKGLTLSPPADRRALVRRAYYDLIGLPPAADEVAAFEADESSDAYEKMVDRLLASPHYGERWGRHWLDVARYADSKGYVFQEDRSYPYAYTYRDYVIRSLNEDKPFDRFVAEQLAADKLPLGSDNRPLAALGFLTVGRRFMNNVHDIIDDRIDVVTRGLMGLTVSCARCHDHKFDPVPTADYYSLYGVFAGSTEPKDLPLVGEVARTKDYERFEAEVRKREGELADFRAKRMEARLTGLAAVTGAAARQVLEPKQPERIFNRADRNEITRLQRRIDQFKASSPDNPPRAMVLNDLPKSPDTFVFLRGNPGNRGPAVPRQFPQVASGSPRKPFADGSGRLELAKAVVAPDNPLTARVIVNRVWLWHFGRGLVRTPSDFGVRSDPPTHPELLDWLANRFVEDGWSLKKLHRRIMLSAVYRQASLTPPELAKLDPENRLLGRADRRRLDFEQLRDSLLVAAGKLDRTVGGRSVDLFKEPFPSRRSVYGLIDRQNLPGTFRVFDLASPDGHTPQRFQTTVPQQALFLMNSPFVAAQAKAVAARPEVQRAETPVARVRALYRAVLGRGPTAAEVDMAKEFAAMPADGKPSGPLGPWELVAQVLLLSNEFAFVD